MPSSTSPDGPTPRAFLVLAVLAVLVASLPATVVAVPSAAGGTDAIGSGIASDRATCPQDPASTGTVARSANSFQSPTPNGSADLSVARGDIAVVPLSVPAGANVTVTVGSGDGYTARLAVRDDGDGRVRLLVNTYLAGNRTTVAPGTYRVAGDDAVTATGGTPTEPLEPGTYPVTATRNETVVGERELTVTEPSFESVTARRAVPRLFDAPNASAIRAANRSGLTAPLEPGEYDPEVVEGETLLVRIDAPSLLGVIAAQSGNTTTERFLALHDRTEPETNETFSIMGPCGGILFHETATEGGARVLLDHRAGAAYVLLDTTNLEGTNGGRQTVYVEVAPESRLGDAGQERELTTSFRIADRQTAIRPTGTDTVRLTADDRATVTGETNLLPGSRVSVRIESRVEPTFERRTEATVAENGTFTATFDLSNASAPGLFVVEVGSRQFPARIDDPPGVYWELRQGRTAAPVTDFRLERLDLPDVVGFLVAYRYDPATERFRPVGSAIAGDDELVVEPLHDPQHLLVVAHRDANGNGMFDGPATDPPYRVDGRAVRDWVSVSVGGVAPETDDPPATFDADRVATTTSERRTTTRDATTTPATSTTTPSDSAETTSTTAKPTGDGPDSTDAEIPGLGPLAAVLALLGATALALRSRR